MRRTPIKITKSMQDVGADALERCLRSGRDSRAACHIVFTAMLSESLRELPPRKPPQFTLAGKALPKNPLTRDDFDQEGKRLLGHMPDGTPCYQWLQNIWYLKPPHTKS